MTMRLKSKKVLFFITVLLGALVAFAQISEREVENILMTIENVSDKSQPVQIEINDNHYWGATSIEKFAKQWVRGVEGDEARIRTVYEKMVAARGHYCSWGSPLVDVLNNENMLERLHSYSFACCNGVNKLIGLFYEALGYDFSVISHPNHTFGEVDSPAGKFIIDADLENFKKGPFKLGEDYPNILDPPEKVTRIPVEENFKPVHLKAFDFNLNPGEVLKLYDENINPSFVLLGEKPNGETPEALVNTKTALLEYSTQSALIEEDGKCRTYNFESPFVISAATIENLAPNRIESIEVKFKQDWNIINPIAYKKGKLNLNHHMFAIGKRVERIKPEEMNKREKLFGAPLEGLTISVSPEQGHLREDYDFVMYEDGLQLPYPGSKYSDIRDNGMGRHVVDGSMNALFSTTDDSDPRTNGREYTAEFTDYSSLEGVYGRYGYDIKICSSKPIPFIAKTWAQYNRNLLPNKIGKASSLNEGITVSIPLDE